MAAMLRRIAVSNNVCQGVRRKHTVSRRMRRTTTVAPSIPGIRPSTMSCRGSKVGGNAQSVCAVRGRDDVVSGLLELGLERLAKRDAVVDDEDGGPVRRR